MMKKSLLAMAVAGAVAAPQAGAVTTLYGAVNQTLSQVDSVTKFTGSDIADQDYSATRVHDNNSKLGVKGSEDLGGGMSAIFKIEYGLGLNQKAKDPEIVTDADGNSSSASSDVLSGSTGLTQRNTFVGLKGNFGTFLMGRHDVPAKIALGKVAYAVLGSGSGHALNGSVNLGFSNHIRANNILAYISPNFNGFTFAVATIAGEEPDIGGTGEINDGIVEGFSFGLMYSNGPWYVGWGGTGLNKGLNLKGTANPDDRGIGGLAIKYAPSNWEVGYMVETDTIDNDKKELVRHYLYGGMKFGANKVYLQLGNASNELEGSDVERSMFGLAFKHSLSKRSSFWAAVTSSSDDGSIETAGYDYNSGSLVSLGLTHKF